MVRYPQQIFTFFFSICIVASAIGENITRMDLKSARLSDRGGDQQIEIKYFNQKWDHFAKNSIIQWKQRYLEDATHFNGKHYRAGDKRKLVDNNIGPIFLLLGGQKPIDDNWLESNLWTELAETHKALVIGLDQRFYGLIDDTMTIDLSMENLQYLTVAQTLKDTENFITKKNNELLLKSNKWIVFGSNYGGTVAAWMNRNYPTLVTGAIACSAIFPKDVFLSDFYKRLNDAVTSKTYSSTCSDNIKTAISQLRVMMKDASKCIAIESTYKVKFKEPCNLPKEKSLFFKILSTTIVNCLKSDCIIKLCNEMDRNTKFNRETHLANAIEKMSGNRKTIGYQNFIEHHKSTESTSSYAREKVYQKCTEFGNLLTFGKDEHPFFDPDDNDYELHICTDIFGEKYNEQFIRGGLNRINLKYGSLNSHFSKTTFIVGTEDLRIDAQMSKNNLAGNIVKEIQGSSDCDDILKPSLPTDSQEKENARSEMNAFIKEGIENLLNSDRDGDEKGFKYFRQVLDHFNQTDNDDVIYWDQRYLEDATYFRGKHYKADDHRKFLDNSPIFLLLGGQKPIKANWLNEKLWMELAETHKALLIGLEQRYYGLIGSIMELSTENLQYLTVAQTLKDTEQFMINKNNKNSFFFNKWIVFGIHYGGTVAAWMKRNYPTLVTGAIACSAVFPKQVVLPEYYKRMNDAVTSKTYSPKCSDNIKAAISQLRVMMENTSKCSYIEDAYKVQFKKPCNSPKEKSLFFRIIGSTISLCLQSECIFKLCTEINKRRNNFRESHFAIALGNSINTNIIKIVDYDIFIERHKSTKFTHAFTREKMYQQCTEFGNIPVFGSNEHLFFDPNDIDFELHFCTDIFGEKYNEQFIRGGINRINSEFGGLDSLFSRTIFIVGTEDLKIDAQMSKNNLVQNIVFEIQGSFESDDPKMTDSEKLSRAKYLIKENVDKLIAGKPLIASTSEMDD